MKMKRCVIGFLLFVLVAGVQLSAQQSDTNSIESIRDKAEKGDADAEHLLGLYYFAGIGVTKDWAESAKWLRKSAEQGYAPGEAGMADARYFQVSVPVQPGNSGGALVDGRGNVIGIVSAKLDAATALAASGALPENVNYAVKSSFLLSFLESVPDVDAKLKKPNTADEKFSDAVKQVQDATVMVLVY